MNYESVPLPSFQPADDLDALMDWISCWIHSPALEDLLRVFGSEDLAAESDLGIVLEKVSEFSATHWDFRNGRERNLVEAEIFDSATETQVIESADSLGLVRSTIPRHEKYDYVLILGGLVRACILRPRYTASLIANGLQTDNITAIGAFRPLQGDETLLAQAAGLLGVTNEIEAMDLGVRNAFELTGVIEEIGESFAEASNRSWRVRTYRDSSDRAVHTVAAPSSDPERRRANTGDTYIFWAENLVHLNARHRILLVTSEIYVPFQGVEAIRLLSLPYGCGVETIGLDTSNILDSRVRQTFGAAQYLQEINSAIRAIRVLHGCVLEAKEI
jgi:hypothetical protein